MAKQSVVLLVVLVAGHSVAHGVEYRDRTVHTISRQLPAIPPVNVSDMDKFLNDLKLSPFWKVEKNRDGKYEAHARSIAPENDLDKSGRQFLFELFSSSKDRPPKNWRIGNHYIPSYGTFTSFSATIVFSAPVHPTITFCNGDGSVALAVHESYSKEISGNSHSTLAIRLSKTRDIYLLVREQGQDRDRTTTFAKLPSLISEVTSVSELPARYRVEERYRRFFRTFFQSPLKDKEVKRLPGSQDRDTFYGYFKSKPGRNYEGVNVRISHPVYCEGECTDKFKRAAKAEYLGTPYYDNDVLFFLIEDNAVYLHGDYNKDFGTFSGNSSFTGTLELLDGAGAVLCTTTDKFKGWEQ